ncbi:histidine kinase [Mesobacillus harenae]|uniref:histidine kinase n=1 Tax=Mesobacillus harenae TaxID=2213203 RepID=UPI00157FC58F
MEKKTRYLELTVLKEIAELLNESTEVLKLLSEVLQKLLHVTGLETGWIFLINEKGEYQLAAHKFLPPALSIQNYEPMCSGMCWCIDKYNRNKLDKATNIIECKRIEEALEERRGDTLGLTHHATVPLRAGEEKFGILNVGSPHKTHFIEEELALLESVAFQIGTALKRINLSHREQETALAGERNRLARDLHDSVNQLLFSLSLTARAGVEMTPDADVKHTFNYIQDLSQEALSEMRALIWQLRPEGLERGIISALKGYAQMLGLSLDTTITGVSNLPSMAEEALWRIGQEALANCKKHSGETSVSLVLKIKKNQVTMIVSDNGHGFNYNVQTEIPSLGLRSMKERAEALNGKLKLNSKPGKGTAVTVTIPI